LEEKATAFETAKLELQTKFEELPGTLATASKSNDELELDKIKEYNTALAAMFRSDGSKSINQELLKDAITIHIKRSDAGSSKSIDEQVNEAIKSVNAGSLPIIYNVEKSAIVSTQQFDSLGGLTRKPNFGGIEREESKQTAFVENIKTSVINETEMEYWYMDQRITTADNGEIQEAEASTLSGKLIKIGMGEIGGACNITNAMMQDSDFDIIGEVNSQLNASFLETRENKYLYGNQTAKNPSVGIFSPSYTSQLAVEEIDSSTPLDILFAFERAKIKIRKSARPNSKILLNPNDYLVILKILASETFGGTGFGMSIINTFSNATNRPTPIILSDYAPRLYDADGAPVVGVNGAFVGDCNDYVRIVKRNGIRFIKNPYRHDNVTRYSAYVREGGGLSRFDGFATLKFK
jgi:HK97 family phage major capsid protein